MLRLVKAGLVGKGLLRIDTEEIVSRYNKALERIGSTPTSLKSFQVDGIGWSPEVAKEKNDPFYLLAGGAHQFAIVLSPDQKGKPIYASYASYLLRLMREYFDRWTNEIADITTTHAIILNIDPEVSRYKTPSDLLYVRQVIVRSDAGDLFNAALLQKKIVAALVAEGDGWFDKEMRQKLIAHAGIYGDLRYRQVHISDVLFNSMDCFYSEAFQGVFVLRNKRSEYLITVEEEVANEAIFSERIAVLHSESPDTLGLLFEEQFVEVNLMWWAQHRDVLQDLRDCLTATCILDEYPHESYVNLSEAKRKTLLATIGHPKKELLEEVEWFNKRLSESHTFKKNELNNWSSELKLLLARPCLGGTIAQQETVPLLLSRMRGWDPYEVYGCDKNRFVRMYREWSDAKKEWAIQRISEKYVPLQKIS